MRILYVGSHGVLEYDELRILGPICSSIFSIGYYIDPDNPVPNVRPPLALPNYDRRALEIWKEENLTPVDFIKSARFLSRFDLILMVHDTRPIAYFEGELPIPLVLRTIGQNDIASEWWISYLKTRIHSPFYIVRYSPLEQNIDQFAGADAIIRFGKFHVDFKQRWAQEQDNTIVTFASGLNFRAGACTFEFYKCVTDQFPRVVYGSLNPDADFMRPGVTHDEQLHILAGASVYLSLNTAPASYTLNFMEGLASGCAVVAPGREVIASSPEIEERVRLPEAYEVPDLLAGAPIELAVSDVDQGRRTLARLLADPELRRDVGSWCRERFTQYFEGNRIREEWRQFLSNICAR